MGKWDLFFPVSYADFKYAQKTQYFCSAPAAPSPMAAIHSLDKHCRVCGGGCREWKGRSLLERHMLVLITDKHCCKPSILTLQKIVWPFTPRTSAMGAISLQDDKLQLRPKPPHTTTPSPSSRGVNTLKMSVRYIHMHYTWLHTVYQNGNNF